MLTPIRIFAAMFLVVTPVSANEAVDDYVACLIGQAAVALNKQVDQKDVAAALDTAYGKCKAPQSFGDAEPDGVEDFVVFMVEKLATGDSL